MQQGVERYSLDYVKNELSDEGLSRIDDSFKYSLLAALHEVINYIDFDLIDNLKECYSKLDNLFKAEDLVDDGYDFSDSYDSSNNAFKYIEAIFVIGSVADGRADDNSDVDLVLITGISRHFLDCGLSELKETLHKKYEKRVQIIIIGTEDLYCFHLDYKTTMLHSINKGIELFNKNIIEIGIQYPLPTMEYIKTWLRCFSHNHKYGLQELRLGWDKPFSELRHIYVSDHLARVLVNVCILYLELIGYVPTTKKQIIFGIAKHKPEIVKELRLALNIRQTRIKPTILMAMKLYNAVKHIKKELLSTIRTIAD